MTKRFDEQAEDCWKELIEAVYAKDLARSFHIIKRLLWLERQITIRK